MELDGSAAAHPEDVGPTKMIKKLNRSFQEAISSQGYFRGWAKEKPREYWQRTPEHVQGIELQVDKYWDTAGGKFAINLWNGHRWSVPSIGSGRCGEIETFYTRLSDKMTGDAWWSVNNETELEAAMKEIKKLLQKNAIPWFERVWNKVGALEWRMETYGEYSFFREYLEIYGTDAFYEKIREWLSTCPRGIEAILEWLVIVGVISADVAGRIRLASFQTTDGYREEILTLLPEIQQSTGRNR
ncbi:DUF4304 domain-containing protein [Geomonas oryzisoli]|uniref:DUF4304 domain-containing protein n=1 Tax=Geomonas oryzisoli TaxID=2847992 RepID=A0ABX8J1J2_9BACT|nr:DUF4304 domain-containing protein [Geomonas oryzisoli]QWV92153.1 DUF4304 domain-containing protein [Geomonas oryzisoli]